MYDLIVEQVNVCKVINEQYTEHGQVSNEIHRKRRLEVQKRRKSTRLKKKFMEETYLELSLGYS